MMTNDKAIYAIPGLMPPHATAYDMVLTGPENGGLRMLVHVGAATDSVSYAIRVPGWDWGVIKDPDYAYYRREGGSLIPLTYTKPDPVAAYNNRPMDLLQVMSWLPADVIVPKINIRGMATAITELPDVPATDPVFFVLNVPIGTLPPGPVTVELCINQRRRDYIVNFPRFSLHGDTPDLTQNVIPWVGTPTDPTMTLNLDIVSGRNNTVRIDLHDIGGNLITAAFTLRSTLTISYTTFELPTTWDSTTSTLSTLFPAILPKGSGNWEIIMTMAGVDRVIANGTCNLN